jgi:hypothetical protein
MEFHEHRRLVEHPDPRRLDLHASCRNPAGDFMVRVMRERRAAQVQVIADLSGSLSFAGVRRKMDVLADFVEAAALSAHQIGDAFGFIGADERVREDLRLPSTRARGAAALLAPRLRGFVPVARSAAGLEAAAAQIGRRPTLVFLVSDFHLPDALLEAVLASLARHMLVPVVLWDPGEFAWTARSGITAARDLETGRVRTLWLRPVLRQQLRAAFALRREALTACFRAHGLRPLFLQGGFDADRVTRHFLDPDEESDADS